MFCFLVLCVKNIRMKTKIMSPFILALNLLFLILPDHMEAFHVDKPMIYINFFDEVVSDNASSKFSDHSTTIHSKLSTVSTSSSNNSEKEIRKGLDLKAEHLQLNDENKTSASAPHDLIFAFDLPNKADITEMSDNETHTDPTTTAKLTDIIDPDLLEPEITRMFFLKAIANLIEHIMEALFSVDDTQKSIQTDSQNFDDYYVAPSRNLRKRELPTVEDSFTKPGGVESSVEPKADLKRDISKSTTLPSADTKLEKKDTESTVSSSTNHESELMKTSKLLVENLTEHSFYGPSDGLVPEHVSSHQSSHGTTAARTHTSKEGHEAKSSEGIKGQNEIENHQDGKVLHHGKLIAHRSPPKKLTPNDEDDMKMFHFSRENSVLNDEVVDKKDEHVLGGGIHLAADKGDNKFVEHVIDEDDDYSSYSETSSLLTWLLIMISTTTMILMIIVAFGIAAVYFFRKNQSQSGNQNASNPRSVIA